METLELRADPREITGKRVKTLRQKGFVPGIIYGHNIDPIPVQFDNHELNSALGRAGTSSTVQVHIKSEEDPLTAIFRDVQFHPIRRNIIHVDLQALDITETVRVPVTVVLVGEPPAIEEGGVLLQILNELDIEALPTALIPSLEVDVSSLDEIGKSISVGDIEPPEGVTIHNAPSETIAQVTWIEEEEEEELEGAPEMGEVAVIGEEGVEEGEMPEEGEEEAAPPEEGAPPSA